ATLRDAAKQMLQNDFSQLPVVENGRILGIIQHSSVASAFMEETLERLDDPVERWLEEPTIVGESTTLWEILQVGFAKGALLVVDAENELAGIVTKYDLIEKVPLENATAFLAIRVVEITLRNFALTHLPAAELDWESELIPKDVQDSCKGRQERRRGGETETILDYVSFGEYEHIFCGEPAWSRVFEPVLGAASREGVRRKLKSFAELRNALVHSRSLAIEDLNRFGADAQELFSLLDSAPSPVAA
ncbi:MAG: CBS domain-containing protein, partial [Terriglobia bacterium]